MHTVHAFSLQPAIPLNALQFHNSLAADSFIGSSTPSERLSAIFRRHTLRNPSRGMNWFMVSRGRLEYRGRITREPFRQWASTKEGTEAIARVASGLGFSLFGRSRAARRRMWR